MIFNVVPNVLGIAAQMERHFFRTHLKDDEHMPIVVRILEDHGATVYLDKKDPTLSSSSGREVAKTLRSRIKVCRKFIVFASNHIKDSRWVPWELGLSDGYKDSKNTAIFPAIDNAHETRWTEQEYLGAYDRVVWGDLQGYTQPWPAPIEWSGLNVSALLA